jgi:riboflavin biosynthesis pyrimidine reductase
MALAVEIGRRGFNEVTVETGAKLNGSLLAAGVVDELKLVIAPCIVGRGRRLLDHVPRTRLEPIRSESSPSGYLLVDYRVVR